MSMIARIRRRTRAWARRRHGVDSDPFTVPSRRVYILPTRLGIFYAGMIFLMFLGAMNYANNLALALAFILASMGLVAMHHCQRNLAGVRIRLAGADSVFAGEVARFCLALESDAPLARQDITVASDASACEPALVAAHERSLITVGMPTAERGRFTFDHLQVSSSYPFGLFRAWTHVHIPMSCVVYPRLAAPGKIAPPTETDIGGAQDSARGDEDFAGLRNFASGDSPRRIAWKAYARGLDLQVKQYAGTAVTSHFLDWDSLPGSKIEDRLSQLARWIEDAHAAGIAYGLRIPGTEIPINVGTAHRQRCLTSLALFGSDHAYPQPTA